MEYFSFPIPDHVANIIFGEQKSVFTESFAGFTQSGLVAEGTIQFNASTKSCSVLKFSVEQDRKDEVNEFSELSNDIQNLEHPAEIHQVHLEKKSEKSKNVQNFVSSVWGSEKPKIERQLSKEEMYRNLFLESNATKRGRDKYKYNYSDEVYLRDNYRENLDERISKNGDNVDWDLSLKFTSKAEKDNGVSRKIPQNGKDFTQSERNEHKTTSMLPRDKTDVSGDIDLQEDSLKSPELNLFPSDVRSMTNSDLYSQVFSAPQNKIPPLSKSESYNLHPKENKETPSMRGKTNSDITKESETDSTNHDLLDGQQKEESEEIWNLNEVMDSFNEKYPDLNSEESLYESILLHGESESTKEIFENVLMLADSNGFEMKDTSPTGNCMFQAINDQLQINGDFRFDVYTLRHQSVEYLESHPTDTDGTHLESFLDEPWNAYLARMAQPYEWGDHLVLKALCEVIRRKVVVINVETGDKTNHHEFEPKSLDQNRNETLYLGHLGEFHYVSLRLKNWKQSWISASLRNKDLENKNMCSPRESHSKIDNYSIGNLSDVDPISQIPIPYLSFAMQQITENSELCFLEIPNMVVPNEGFRITTAGGRSDGTEVFIIHKDKSKHREEYWSRFSFEFPVIVFYHMYSTVICDGKTTPLPEGQIRAELGGTHPGYCTLYYFGKRGSMLTAPSEVKVDGREQHPGKSLNGYHCPEWPACAKEWLTRETNWPPVRLKEKIASHGCFVAKRHHANSRAPKLEWQFIFNDAEKILVEEALTKSHFYVYGVFKSCVDHYSQHLRNKLGTVHIKSIFFYGCEQIPGDTFDDSPGVCFLHLVELLLKKVKEQNVPNYFIKENNMIDHYSDDDIEKLIQILEAIRYFPLHCLVFMMDARGYNRSDIIDVIQKDIKTYGREIDLNRSFCHLFFPMMVRQARKLAKCKKYKEAYGKIRDARLLLVLAPQKVQKPVFVPSLDNLLIQTLEAFDEDTVNLVTREMKVCKLDFSTVMKLKDLTDGKDVGGLGELPLPSHVTGNPIEEARLLNRYGVILHNMDRNYDDASTYYSFALDKLKLAVVKGDAHRDEKNIDNVECNQYDCHHLAFLCFKNLLASGKLEKLEPRMPFLEEICIRGKFTKQVDFVMELWEKLGHPDSAAKFHSSFLEQVYSFK